MRTTRVLAIALLAVTPIACVSSAQAAPVSTGSAEPAAVGALPAAVSAEGARYAETILSRVNELRASLGLAPVTRYVELDAIAQDWSEGLATQGGGLSHRPDMSTVYPSGWISASENVAMNGSAQSVDVGDQIFEQWLNSPGHYANMTDPAANSIGIGMAYSAANGSWYATQNFGAYPDAQAAGLTPTTPSNPSMTDDGATTPPAAVPPTPAPSITEPAPETAAPETSAPAAGEETPSAPLVSTSSAPAAQTVAGTVGSTATASQAPSKPSLAATGVSLAGVAMALIAGGAGVAVLRLRRRV